MSYQEVEDRPGLPEVILEHDDARVRLSLQGAHITEYVIGQDDLLWVSESARFAPGASIRGGIPICWPWFGASLDDPDWPQHGFARRSRFRIVSHSAEAASTSVTLALEEPAPIPEWQEQAHLELEVRLSDHLWMELRTTNISDRELLVGAGLHSYFQVSDAGQISIPALTGREYLDKTEAFARKTQSEPLRVDGEVDRVYVDPPGVVELIDLGFSRKVSIEAWGNADVVVWNPGPKVAAAMDDFDDAGYPQMVCIEPAIALERRIHLAPGETCAIGQTIRRLSHP